MAKLWGGRFSGETDKQVEQFTSSLHLDQKLWSADITASIAHCQMLKKQNIIPNDEAQKIIFALSEIHEEFASGKTTVNLESEDIHSDIENKLKEKVGAISGKLHTARSRNDQVSTDTRLYLREENKKLLGEISELQKCILQIAENHCETILPGMTHMQHAQPVSLAHHLCAYFWMLSRDFDRLSQAQTRINILPLGSAALAGTGFPLDRQFVAKELNFSSVTPNSLDAVSDRDFVIEFLSDAAMLMMHLSRLSEEIILWSTPEFAFVELSDEVTTGSSIMPQKKNPDVAELIRGRVGIVYGNLMGALTMMKGLPLAYNRDMQEDKTFLFQGLETTTDCVRLMKLMLEKAKWNSDRMQQALAGDFSNATDLADYLVTRGMTFRQAHEVTGLVVQFCLQQHLALENITLAQLQKINPIFEETVLQVLPHQTVMKARTSEGGTSPLAVKKQLTLAYEYLQQSK